MERARQADVWRGKQIFGDAGREHASRSVLRVTALTEGGAESDIGLRRRGTNVKIVRKFDELHFSRVYKNYLCDFGCMQRCECGSEDQSC